ncbi:LpxA family transferase [Chlamydiifrater phoenicopteri]|uniref:LpxA family transferase n=1 Tax=Chlamydiifrater phoenicopteri TaxID=2681469 RepID=UPI001BCBC4BD|nr:LpxA family transferase [Chlamydiifrater phoenicopteri]
MFFLTKNVFPKRDFPFSNLFDEAENVWDILDNYKRLALSYQFKGILGTVEPGAFFKNEDKIEIEEGAYIESGAYIVGPCFLGAGTVVRQGAYLRGDVFVGRSCVIGHCTELKNVCFGREVKAAHFAYVGDSVLASRVNLGAGVRCANFRLDGGDVVLRDGKTKISTEKRKLGAFIGEAVSVGCNVVINPGTIIADNVQILPGEIVSGTIKR